MKSTSDSIPWEDLMSLPELTPPSVMPQGNVGTPLSTFMTLIRTCKLPAHVIKKLQLEFPKSRSNKRYGAVKFDYETEDHMTDNDDHVTDREDHVTQEAERTAKLNTGSQDVTDRDDIGEGESEDAMDEIPSVWHL